MVLYRNQPNHSLIIIPEHVFFFNFTPPAIKSSSLIQLLGHNIFILFLPDKTKACNKVKEYLKQQSVLTLPPVRLSAALLQCVTRTYCQRYHP